MPRIARVTVPGIPHHITQRGNRKLPTFFQEKDYQEYKKLLFESCLKFGLEIWSYCLMTNHVHLIAIPSSEASLYLTLGETHQKYTRYINFREGWRGHLWQGRFSSFPMDEAHTLVAARYIELNPVKAYMVKKPEEYPWSSARAHLLGHYDFLVSTSPLSSYVKNWKDFLEEASFSEDGKSLQKHERTGRPLGGINFITELERKTGRTLLPKKAGRKPLNKEIGRVSPD